MVVFKRRTYTIFIKLENSTRLMMVLYGLVFYETMTWFMALEALIMHKLGFISCRWEGETAGLDYM